MSALPELVGKGCVQRGDADRTRTLLLTDADEVLVVFISAVQIPQWAGKRYTQVVNRETNLNLLYRDDLKSGAC